MTHYLRKAALPAVVALTLGPICAFAQGGKAVVGAWSLVSTDTVEGTKRTHTFGDKPMGQATFTANGRYSIIITRADLPAFAANNRTKGSDKEKAAVNDGLIAHYGSYTVKGSDIILKVESSSFPNWKGQEQKRAFTVKGNELRWTNAAASGGGVAELVWKRL